MKMHTYRVRGRGRFPVGGLRLAHAWPATRQDVDFVEYSWVIVKEPKGLRSVTIMGTLAPDETIWAKWGWEVL